MRAVPRSSRSARPARRIGVVASLAVVSVLAVGCGDDSDDAGSGDPAAVLSEDQVASAAIGLDNLGEGWTEEPADEEEDSPAPGCLGEIDQVTETDEPAAEVEKTYGHGEISLPRVQSGVATFDDEDSVASAFDDVQVALADCTTVEGTDEEGTEYNLTLTYDDSATGDAVDDQLNLVAAGTILTPGGQEVSLSLHMTMARIDNNVALIATSDFSDPATLHASVSQIGIDKLAAVVAGEEPPATTAPAPA